MAALVTMIAIIVLLSGLFYQYIIFPYFVSPLSKIPNAHFTAPLASTWIWWKRKKGKEFRTIYSLHQKHGPVVRLGPNELSVNSIAGLRIIYTGGFEKHDWYRGVFLNFGTENLVSTLGHEPHSVRRRALSNVYSKSYLQNSPDFQVVSSTVVLDRFLPLLGELARTKTCINVLPLAQALGMDFTSAYLFGTANGTNFLHDMETRDRWLGLYETFKHQDPRDRAFGDVEKWCLSLCERAERWETEGKQTSTKNAASTDPVVYREFSQGLEKSPQGSQSKHLLIASEMLDHLIAGHETSGITITYLLWEMSQHPELQARLRQELLTLSPPVTYPDPASGHQKGDPRALLSVQALDSLPLLGAIIRETLRLHAPVSGPQPRITPCSSSPLTIEGYDNIPGGVKVSSSAYTLHRIPEVYPRPEEWLPERWLENGPGGNEDMRRLFWAFGSGGRMCLGSNFALQEIKLVTAAIYTNFTTVIMDDAGIEQIDAYIAPPKSHKLVIEFSQLSQQ